MNTDLKKTLSFTGVAAVLLAAAALTWPRVPSAQAFADQGEPFFAEFRDPREAASLEVIDFDPDTASALPFAVELDAKKGWSIPSHHDYPADGKDRLARTAAGVIDLKKDVVVSDSADQHEAMGVHDPLDPKVASIKGRGKRVTLKDKAGKVLADLIVGKSVPDPDRKDQRYVRVPGQKRTYAVTFGPNFELSSRFGDWIETNLLKLNSSDILRINIDNHTVDIERGTLTPGDIVLLDRSDASAPWTLDKLPADRELDTQKVSALTTALGDLKIVGVRPKPPGLTSELKAQGGGEKGLALNRASINSLANRGFYLVQGQLVSNQGDILVATREGIVYTLRFGEVTFARGDALSAGSETDGSPEPGKESEKQEGATESRYLLVTARFDPTLIPTKTEPPNADGELPGDVFQRTPEEKKQAEEKATRDREEYDRKVADGKKKAQELTDRFAGWYYLVPGDAFRNIVVDRASLTRPKGSSPSPAAGAFPGGLPGGLPPGLNFGNPPGGVPHP